MELKVGTKFRSCKILPKVKSIEKALDNIVVYDHYHYVILAMRISLVHSSEHLHSACTDSKRIEYNNCSRTTFLLEKSFDKE